MKNNINSKWAAFLLTLMIGGFVVLTSATTQAQISNIDPNAYFEYPKHGQVLNHGQGYMVKAKPTRGASHHWLTLRQGQTTFNNWQNATNPFPQFAVWPDNPVHSQFEANRTAQIQYTERINGSWQPYKTIEVILADATVAQTIREIKADLHSRSNGTATYDSFAPVTWPSTALGCAQSGQAYSTINVDGFVIHFLDLDGQIEDRQSYSYHADNNGNFVYCP